ncbi:MAG: 23S rRNA (pseudouridine(1915)-N(3))-methyltransferase RlmH [Prevotellaceae bacterium]|jgi:23S rRNA (pseudouridine1915-N3)-methyltransferase|nr:23S rRNA (pseudouridine(1915)-N(3))-methyltransferase RlmH [Prevotellaceae bacterium]
MTKISFLIVGKTTENFVTEAITKYANRLKHYVSFDILVIPELKNTKNMPTDQQKQKEGEAILKSLTDTDEVILLDERGKTFSSIEFAGFLENKIASSAKRLVFVIGGAYGFSESVYNRANEKISLSKMTFSHQIIRLIFMEQLYRAMTIIKGEPYHHE